MYDGQEPWRVPWRNEMKFNFNNVERKVLSCEGLEGLNAT
jgi:hypothetical protein